MTATVTWVLWAALGAANPQALVVPYQASGVEEGDVTQLGKALRDQVQKHGWTPLDESVAQKQAKAASMCGEDADCLATLGQRAGAQWVLAFSLGQVKKGVIASALLVEVATGQRRSGSTEKLVAIPEDFTNVARALVDPLFRDVPSPVVLTPAVTSEQLPAVTAAAPHPLRGVGAGLLVAGGVVGLGGMVLGIVAGNHYETLKTMSADQRGPADNTQRALNISADVAVSVGLAALATGVVLLIADAASAPAPAETEGDAQ